MNYDNLISSSVSSPPLSSSLPSPDTHSTDHSTNISHLEFPVDSDTKMSITKQNANVDSIRVRDEHQMEKTQVESETTNTIIPQTGGSSSRGSKTRRRNRSEKRANRLKNKQEMDKIDEEIDKLHDHEDELLETVKEAYKKYKELRVKLKELKTHGVEKRKTLRNKKKTLKNRNKITK